jgi:hypothetical protein
MKTYIDVLWPENFPIRPFRVASSSSAPKLPSSPIPLVIPAIPDVKGGSRNTSPDSRPIRHVPSKTVVIASMNVQEGLSASVANAMMRWYDALQDMTSG